MFLLMNAVSLILIDEFAPVLLVAEFVVCWAVVIAHTVNTNEAVSKICGK
jgi:hypothetical protein